MAHGEEAGNCDERDKCVPPSATCIRSIVTVQLPSLLPEQVVGRDWANVAVLWFGVVWLWLLQLATVAVAVPVFV